jgi:hypothetical protein
MHRGVIRRFAPKIVHFPQPVGVFPLEEHEMLKRQLVELLDKI